MEKHFQPLGWFHPEPPHEASLWVGLVGRVCCDRTKDRSDKHLVHTGVRTRSTLWTGHRWAHRKCVPVPGPSRSLLCSQKGIHAPMAACKHHPCRFCRESSWLVGAHPVVMILSDCQRGHRQRAGLRKAGSGAVLKWSLKVVMELARTKSLPRLTVQIPFHLCHTKSDAGHDCVSTGDSWC